MKLNPWISFIKANFYLILGRLHFPTDRIGEIIVEDGQKFTIFRQLIKYAGLNEKVGPKGVFKARFRVANMSPRKNKIFSLLTIPFFSGLPGFRSKLWVLSEETGYFMGIYEWATLEDAGNYSRSFAVNFMIRRADQGSAKFEVVRK